MNSDMDNIMEEFAGSANDAYIIRWSSEEERLSALYEKYHDKMIQALINILKEKKGSTQPSPSTNGQLIILPIKDGYQLVLSYPTQIFQNSQYQISLILAYDSEETGRRVFGPKTIGENPEIRKTFYEAIEDLYNNLGRFNIK